MNTLTTNDLIATGSLEDSETIGVPEIEPRDVSDRDVAFMVQKQNDLLMMGYALVLKEKHVYQGTVPAHVKRRRRARGKAARLARRVHRRSRG